MAFGISTYRPSGRAGLIGGGRKQILQKVVLSATLTAGNVATFTQPIPDDYELYFNGQWHNKGMMNEIQEDDVTLVLPGVIWEASQTMDLKYYRLV
jgi:hypothetical protein